jgi:predicted GTPase
MSRKNVLIMGAAGRDFHNFNLFFRDKDEYNVKAFTATQIPDITDRKYPAKLAGKLYPDGIPIYPESDLLNLIRKNKIDIVIFSYSDVSNSYVMEKASMVLACGANFMLLGSDKTMLKSKVPVVSICAVRTGCGKSQTTRKVSDILKQMGKKIVVIRHPMPYGDLEKQEVQRFTKYEDFKTHKCTIEEMEEYEPHIDKGSIVYAGVDYEKIMKKAEKEADVILWDGGNNDMSFYKPDLSIVVTDPHRAGHEISYFPGSVNFISANVIVINKIDSADLANINTVRSNIRKLNPEAIVVEAASPIFVDDPELIRGKKVLVVEDGPTLTHGEMKYGAGIVAAQKFGAAVIVDPRPYTVGSITETFQKYTGIGTLLPAMGYGKKQVQDLEKTINSTECDAVIIATPIDLKKLVKINKPSTRVRYELEEIGQPDLKSVIDKFIK